MQSSCSSIQSKISSEQEKLTENSTFIKQNIKTLMNVLDTKLVELFNEPSVHNLPSPEDFTKAIESTLNCVFRNKYDMQNEIKSIDMDEKTMPAKNRQIYSDRLVLYRSKVAKAANNKQIFSITGMQTQITKSLRKRGWIQKLALSQLASIQNIPQNALLMFAAPGNNFETMLLSKLAQMYPSNFEWQPRNSKEKFSPSLQNNLLFRNRIQYLGSLYFSRKDTLYVCIQKANYRLNDTSDTYKIQAPRLHNLRDPKDSLAFLKDYRTTSCFCLLKFLNDKNIEQDELFSQSGILPLSILVFAIEKVRYVNSLKQDANLNYNGNHKLLGEDNLWEYFYKCSKSLMNKTDQFKMSDMKNYDRCEKTITDLLIQSKKYWPDLFSDGYNNLWILKPSCSCQGKGIYIKEDFLSIINFVKSQVKKNYIVQKYIERPLLIYNTKFDIRQYMLLVITKTKLNLWLYKECYLRFCSQEFNLNNLDKSIHITNNSVQKKLKNGKRSSRLPQHNMWSLEQFKDHLKLTTKHNDIWSDKIYKCIKSTCKKIILSCIEAIQFVPKTFEFYGCDFIIDANYDPYIIEVNSSPDLSHSTMVTGKICPAALEDLIKVVVDLPKNPDANTGNFELIHSINWHELNIKK